MPRRSTVQRACQSCRKSRTKCDGRQACGRCKAKSLHCSYERPESLSKAMLRSEVKRLQEQLDETDILFNALTSDPREGIGGTANLIIGALSRGDSRESIIKTLRGVQEVDKYHSQAAQDTIKLISPPSPAAARRGSSHSNPASHPPTACDLESEESQSTISAGSGTAPHCSPGSSSLLGPASNSSTALPKESVEELKGTYTFPVRCLVSQLDIWTSSGWTRSYVRNLITSVLSWDAIPLCVVDAEHFMADFNAGASQYCSSALVHALLALSIRIREAQQPKQADASPTDQISSQDSYAFLHQASVYTSDYGPVSILPNIQALGVLSIYQASFGEDDEARMLAGKYVESIADFCLNGSLPSPDSNFDRICADTYHGAVSLQRLLRLTGVAPTTQPAKETQEVLFINALQHDDCDVSTVEDGDGCCGLGATPSIGRANPCLQNLLTAMFQLTGWLSKLEIQASCGLAPDVMLELYFRCLGWYSDTFAPMNGDDDDKIAGGDDGDYSDRNLKFLAFTHMFYHYSIIEILTSAAVDREQYAGNLQIHDICRSAAQGVLSLATPMTALGCFEERPQPAGRLTSHFVSTAESFLTAL